MYSKIIYKLIDIVYKFNIKCMRLKYWFHPDISLGKNVVIGKGVSLKVIWGGSIKIGDNTKILDNTKIWTYGGDIIIGDNCSINPLCIIYGQSKTIIGNDVLIAGHTMIIPSNHNFEDKSQLIRKQGVTEKGIYVNSNVWIENGCTILDGVTIHSGSVVAARAVVNKDVESYTVVGGVPAKKIKSIV